MLSNKLLVGFTLAGFLILTTACTGIAKSLAGQPLPAYGVNEELATLMGCDLADIQARGERYKRQSFDAGGPGYVVPSIGDTGCDVLAKLGRPDDSGAVTTEVGSALNFWYRTGTTQRGNVRMHLVVLEPDESRGGTVVTSVVW